MTPKLEELKAASDAADDAAFAACSAVADDASDAARDVYQAELNKEK